jgi:hypothetical protein
MSAAKRTSIKPLKALKNFDFRPVQPPLDGVLINIDRDLQRLLKRANQCPDVMAVVEYTAMVSAARFTANSYHAVAYLAADTPEDSRRKPTYVLVVPAIHRQLLDFLFSLVYMLDDFHVRLL